MVLDNSDIDKFIKEFTAKGLRENPLDVLVKIFVNDQDLQILRKDFKTNLLEKLVKKWKNLTNDIEKSAEKSNEIYEKLENLITNTQKKSKEISNIKVPDRKEAINPIVQPSTPVIATVIEENKNKTSPTEEVFNSPLIKNLTNLLNLQRNFNLNSDIDKSSTTNEQKLLENVEKETIISFSDKTTEFLNKLVDRIVKNSDGTSAIFQKIKQNGGGGILDDIIGGMLGGLLLRTGGLLGKIIGTTLLGVGGIGVLTSLFWPEMKGYIEEKFGKKAAETFDKFQGVVNAMGKFFTMGGLQMTFGGAFKTVGTFFGSISQRLADYATDMFKGTIDNILGESVEQGGKVAGKAIGGGLKSQLLKGGSILLKGVSLTALKAIPVIGAVISFGQAYSRFREGEYMQGLIDIAAGLTGLIPGVGTVLSIGLSSLNVFLDFQSSEKKEQMARTSINISGALMKVVGWAAKIGSKLKFLPGIASILSFGLAWDRFQKDDIIGGTLDLVSGIAALVPVYGIPLSLGIDALNYMLDTKQSQYPTKPKGQILSDWWKGFYNFLRESWLVGSIIKASEGLYALFSGNIKQGLSLINELPFFGAVAGTFLSILDAFETTTDPNTGITNTKFSFQNLADNLKKNLYKNLVNFFPEGFGIKSWFAKTFGYTYNEKTQDLVEQPISAINKPTMSKIEKETLKNLPTKYNENELKEKMDEGKLLIEQRENIEKEIEELKQFKPKNKADSINNNLKIQELEKEKESLLEKQRSVSYVIKRQKELKSGGKITSAMEMGFDPEYDVNEDIKNLKLKIDSILRTRDPKRLDKIKLLNKKLEELEKTKNELQAKTQKANFFTNDETISKMLANNSVSSGNSSFFEKRIDNKSGKIISDPKTGNRIELSSDDTIFASKKGDGVDKTFLNLTNSIDFLTKKIENLIMSKELDIVNQRNNTADMASKTPVIINNNTTNNTGGQSNRFKISTGLDEIFSMRSEYLIRNSNLYGNI